VARGGDIEEGFGTGGKSGLVISFAVGSWFRGE
jgi:epoxyqueuosine reductase QueG